MSRSFGRYEASEPLGRGGMGQVWRGRDPMLDRVVAIKELSPARELPAKMREEYRERFFREARAAARLQHPNIVAVYDMGIAGDESPYLVMELVDGMSLEAAFRAQESFSDEEAARIGEAVARALACAHQNGIVHRDVKLANVLRARDGTIKLMDFGIARLQDSTLTQDGNFLGSPQYSSPEQVRGVVPDGRSDLFSLGLMIYILLTRRHPFHRATTQETLRAIVQDPATPPSSHRAGLAAAWDALLLKSLAKDAAGRFADADAMAAAFASVTAAGEPALQGPLDLVVIEGPARGTRVPLEGSVVVGRDAGDLVALDGTVSGKHCRIERAGGRLKVVDLGSTNGTWIDGQRVSEAEFDPGTVITAGTGTKLRAEARAAAPAAPPPATGTVLDGGEPRMKTQTLRPLAGAARLTLVVREGIAKGERRPLTRPIVLGRDEGDLVLGDEKVSRKHAVVEPRPGQKALVRDLASSNGTWLGSERVREVELKAGDEFRVGSTLLALELEGAS